MPKRSKSPIGSHTTPDCPISVSYTRGTRFQAKIMDFTLLMNHTIGNASNENIQTEVTSATQLVTLVVMGELNGTNSIVNGGITSQATFETQLKEIDEELMRFNDLGLNQLKFFGPHPRAKVSESINLAAKPLSKPRDQKIPTRVSKCPFQLRVLPT